MGKKDHRLSLTKGLSNFIFEVRYEDIPSDCIDMAKLCFLDFLGVSILGCKEPVGRIIKDFLEKVGGSPESTIIGYGMRSSVPNAALANGTFGHAVDFDDDSSRGAGHLTSCIAPGLLALAESIGKNGQEILLAFILGYEVASILALAIEPKHTQSGWHATSTLGTFASTAAAAKILGLNRNEIAHAFGIAATQVSGLRRNFGTMCKPLHAGKASQRGVESCLLARMGFNGDPNILDGKWGFLQLFSGEMPDLNIDEFTHRLGKVFLIRENWFKPYPSCGCTHSAIDAAISLQSQYKINPKIIEKIEVGVSPIAFDTLLYDEPKTPYEAKFSMPFCVSSALLEGKVLMKHFSSSRIKDLSLLDLMKKVIMYADPDFAEGGYRGTYGATLRIKMTSGEILTEKVRAPRGHPHNPLSTEALIEKYRDCARSILSIKQLDSSINMIMNLEKMEKVEPLMKLMKSE